MATLVNVTPASQISTVEVINRDLIVTVQKEIKTVDIVVEARNTIELLISRAVSPGVVSIYGSENINVSGHTGNVTVSFTSPNGFASGGNISAPYFLGNVVGNISGNIVVPGLQGDVLFNDSGNAGASDNLQFNKTSNVLTVTGNIVANTITANVNGTVIGNIQPTYVLGNLIPSSNVTYNLGNSTNRFKDLYLAGNTIYLGNYQIDTNSSGITMSGNLTVGNIVTTGKLSGDGSLISNISGANITGTVANATYSVNSGTAYSVSGSNVSGTVANATYSVNSGTAYSVSGSNVSGQVANSLVAGTVYTNAQPNITSVGSLTSLTVAGDATVAGNLAINGNLTYVNVTNLNVQDPVIEMGGGPNGAPLTINDGKDRGTLLHYYTTEPINAFMGWDNSGSEFIFGSNITNTNDVITVNNYGNVHANYFKGNASELTGTIANANYAAYAGTAYSVDGSNVSGTVANAAHATVSDSANSVAGADVTGQVGNALIAGTVYTNAQPNITSVGTLIDLDVTGNVSAGNIKSDNLLYANGDPYVFTTNAAGTNTQVQFNDDDSFAGDVNLTFNKTTGTLTSLYLAGEGGNITSILGTNVSGAVALATNATSADTATVSYTAYSVDGSNVSGSVDNAIYASSAGTASLADYATAAGTASNADNAYSVDGANVVGEVANAGFASISSTTYAVDGANVSGAVANATYATSAGTSDIATTAYSVDGANVVGEVANATYATSAGTSDIATTAYSVDVANVSGIGNIATINLDGNISNVLSGDGTFIAMSGGGGGTPGGSDTQLQYNNAGSFGGIANVTFASGNLSLGDVANVKVAGGIGNTFISTDGAGNLSFQTITSNLTVGTRATAVNIGISNYTMNVESRTGNVTVNVN